MHPAIGLGVSKRQTRELRERNGGIRCGNSTREKRMLQSDGRTGAPPQSTAHSTCSVGGRHPLLDCVDAVKASPRGVDAAGVSIVVVRLRVLSRSPPAALVVKHSEPGVEAAAGWKQRGEVHSQHMQCRSEQQA